MRKHNLAIWLLLIVTTAACSSNKNVNVSKELKSVKSWTATAEMVGDNWIKGNIPKAYAEQTLVTAQKEIEKGKIKLVEAHSIGFLSPLQDLEETVGQMAEAVNQQDRSLLAQKLQHLDTHQKTLAFLP